MKILKDVKDASNATTQKAVHKANERAASPCTTAALQQPFKQGQCRVLRLARNKQLHKQNLGKDQHNSSSAERDLAVIMIMNST